MKSKLKLLSILVGSLFTISSYAQCSTSTWVGDNPTVLTTGTSGNGMGNSSGLGSLAGVAGGSLGSGGSGGSLGGLGSFNGGSLGSVAGGVVNSTGGSNNILGGLGSMVGNATGLGNITSGNATLADYVKAGATVATTYGLVTGNKTATTIGGVGLVAGNAFGDQINSMGSSVSSAFGSSSNGIVQSDSNQGQFSNVSYGNTSSNNGPREYGYNVGDRVDTRTQQDQFSNGLYDYGSSSTSGANGAVYDQSTQQWTTPYQGTTASSLEAPIGETPGWKDGGTRYVPTAAEAASNNSGAGTWMNPTSGNGPTYNTTDSWGNMQRVNTETGIIEPGNQSTNPLSSATGRGDLGLAEGQSMSFGDTSPKNNISSLSPAGTAGTVQASRDTDWSGKGSSSINMERPWVTNSEGINVPWGSAKDDVTPPSATLTGIGSKGDTYTLTRDQALTSDAAARAKYNESMNNYQAPAQITTESLNAALNKGP